MFTLLILLTTGGEISLGQYHSLALCHEVRAEVLETVGLEQQSNFADLICYNPDFGGY